MTEEEKQFIESFLYADGSKDDAVRRLQVEEWYKAFGKKVLRDVDLDKVTAKINSDTDKPRYWKYSSGGDPIFNRKTIVNELLEMKGADNKYLLDDYDRYQLACWSCSPETLANISLGEYMDTDSPIEFVKTLNSYSKLMGYWYQYMILINEKSYSNDKLDPIRKNIEKSMAGYGITYGNPHAYEKYRFECAKEEGCVEALEQTLEELKLPVEQIDQLLIDTALYAATPPRNFSLKHSNAQVIDFCLGHIGGNKYKDLQSSYQELKNKYKQFEEKYRDNGANKSDMIDVYKLIIEDYKKICGLDHENILGDYDDIIRDNLRDIEDDFKDINDSYTDDKKEDYKDLLQYYYECLQEGHKEILKKKYGSLLKKDYTTHGYHATLDRLREEYLFSRLDDFIDFLPSDITFEEYSTHLIYAIGRQAGEAPNRELMQKASAFLERVWDKEEFEAHKTYCLYELNQSDPALIHMLFGLAQVGALEPLKKIWDAADKKTYNKLTDLFLDSCETRCALYIEGEKGREILYKVISTPDIGPHYCNAFVKAIDKLLEENKSFAESWDILKKSYENYDIKGFKSKFLDRTLEEAIGKNMNSPSISQSDDPAFSSPEAPLSSTPQRGNQELLSSTRQSRGRDLLSSTPQRGNQELLSSTTQSRGQDLLSFTPRSSEQKALLSKKTAKKLF